MSVVSFYYYLKVLKQAYVSEPSTDAAITVRVTTRIALWMTAALVVLLGCLPDLLLDRIAIVLH
jgi:NADH:ubiquinone oxidoreductase subunit 2 (subunit N)